MMPERRPVLRDLFEDPPPLPIAEPDGETYVRRFDRDRLAKQHRRVYDLMIDGRWRTLQEISDFTGDQTPSISARLRDMRKEKFGEFQVNRRARGDRTKGLFEYRLIDPDPSGPIPHVEPMP